jgi:hypothetical protein
MDYDVFIIDLKKKFKENLCSLSSCSFSKKAYIFSEKEEKWGNMKENLEILCNKISGIFRIKRKPQFRNQIVNQIEIKLFLIYKFA